MDYSNYNLQDALNSLMKYQRQINQNRVKIKDVDQYKINQIYAFVDELENQVDQTLNSPNYS